MSNPIPDLLALTSIADGSQRLASPIRNNYSDIQTAVNELIAALSGGASGQVLQAVDASHVQFAAASSMEQICDVTLGASQASFDTNTILAGNIPSTYNHLRLVASLRTDQAALLETPIIRFNNDAGAFYDYVHTTGQSGAATSASSQNQTSAFLGACAGASAPAGFFGACMVDILDYRSAVSHKHFLSQGAAEVGTAASLLRNISGIYHPAAVAAITRIQVLPQTGPNFVAGSRFTLYGLI